MTIAARSTNLRRRKAARLEEARVNEIASVSEIGTDYRSADRAGDLEMEAWFQASFAAADEEWRKRIVIGFLKWEQTERREDVAVSGSVEEAVATLKGNNGLWLHDLGPDGTPAA